jgi:hypothetical protein
MKYFCICTNLILNPITMKKIITLLAAAFVLSSSTANAQCISSSMYATASVNSAAPGTSVQVTTCNWGGEYDEITFNAIGAFTFSSSISTDYFTITDGSNNVLAFGFTPLATSIPSVGLYRMHVSASGPTVCATQNACRVTSVFVPLSACAGMPTAGTVPASFSICPNTSAVITATGSTAASGITYQWMQSPNGISGWTNVTGGSGANTTSLTTPTLSTLTYYQMVITCTISAQSATTAVLSVNPNNPVTMCYCNTNLGGSGCSGDYIDNVTILSTPLNNNSLCNNTVTNGTYTYFSPMSTTTATLLAGATYSISVETTASNIESLWIDFNASGTFDASEHTQITTSSTASVPTIVAFTVPLASVPGVTGMRVRSRAVGNPNGPTDACTSFGSGECEDYLVTIVPAVGCTGTPNAGNAVASSTLVCTGSPVNVTLAGSTIASGLTYQWYSSPNGITYSAIPSATNISMNPTISSTIYYQAIVSCGSSTAVSTPVQITMYSGPSVGSISGPTSVPVNTTNSYTVSPASGNLQWYQGSSSTGPWTSIPSATAATSAFNASPSGVQWYIVVASSSGCPSATTAVAYSVNITPAAGDDVCSALTVTLGPSSVMYPFAGFGSQVGEVAPAGGTCSAPLTWCNNTLDNTRWFKFVAPASGYVSIQSPDMDTQLALWQATTCNDLLSSSTASLIAANDDDLDYLTNGGVLYSSFIYGACLTPGTTYYIQLDTYSAASTGDSTRLIVLDMGAPMNASFTGLASTYCLGAPSSSLVPATAGGIFTINTSTNSVTNFNPSVAGTHTVTYAAFGCVTQSVTVVSVCTGIEVMQPNANGTSIYPNPNNGFIYVNVTDLSSTNVIDIYDALGKLVISKTLIGNQTMITTNELPQGMYTYNIRNSAGVIARGKLVKE